MHRTERDYRRKFIVHPDQHAALADAEWPMPETLVQYQRAVELQDANDHAGAIELIAGILESPLRLAPDSVIESPIVRAVYIGGRVIPTINLLRKLMIGNAQYASRLDATGDYKAAIRVESTNLQIAEQIIHLEPAEFTFILFGQSIYRGACKAVAEMHRALNDTETASAADECQTRAASFFESRLRPFAGRMKRKWPWYWLPGQMRLHFQRELAEVRSLVQEWDLQVDI